MADQTATGLPEGAVVGEPLQDGAQAKPVQKQIPQPVQNAGLPEGAVVGPAMTPKQHNGSPKGAIVGPSLPEKPAGLADTLGAIKHNVGNISSAMDNKAPADITPQQQGVAEIGKGVRGLYHGAMGDEESSLSKGKTTTASPAAANLGFTPEHVGYEAGKLGRGVAQFVGGAAKDLAGNTPVVVPNEKGVGISDPTAHTLLAKYVTAPSQAERNASQAEMQKYFESQGPEAAGHAISAFLHGTLGEYVPLIGPLAMAITDQAAKGDIGGALTQIAGLYAFEKSTGKLRDGIKERVAAKVADLTKSPEVKQAEANVEATAKPREAAQAKYEAALAEHNKYSASHAQGIDSPKPVKAALDKAKLELDEATAHHELAQEHLAKQPTIPQRVGGAVGKAIGKVMPTPAPAPEVPAEQVEAAPAPPVLQKLGAPKPAAEPINVKRPGQILPETFPQIPTEAPRSPLGRIDLANEQGTVGKQRMLPEKASAGLPQIKATAPEVLPPEKPAAKPERGNVKALTVDEKGNVVDKEATPEGHIGRLLQEALKPTEKSTAPETNKGAASETNTATEPEAKSLTKAEAKEHAASLPIEEKPVPDKEPGLLKAGEEGREAPKSAAEYHPAVQEQVTALSDENLRKLAKAHGLNPDEYDFKTRDQGRHRIERDKLASEVTEQMRDDEKINIGRSAERLAQNADMANKAKADRAASLFPRLRGPVDEFGNPTVRGGAPEAGTKEAADKDNEHFANAKQELGPKASISEIAKRAQEMKDAASKPLDVLKHAGDYNKAEGLQKIAPEKVEKSPRAKEIADEYAAMKHAPNDPEVKKSYAALIDDVKKQWDYATKKMGINIEPTDKDPYGFAGDKPAEKQLVDDVRNNKHLGVWRGGNELPADHPLAKVDPKTGETYNTMFRAVHDIFGHVAQGHGFSEPGEESAWNVHRQMMSPEAVPAMTTETRGQTSWFFNHGGKPGEFAEQKAGTLPDFASEPTPDSKGTLDHIKSGKDYAVLTAENPNNTRASAEDNAQRNRELVADLRKKGYDPVPVEGNTKDVEGQKEHSFFVKDIKPEEAAELGKKHGQAAVLTTEGLHDLKTDTVNPSDNKNLKLGEEARKEPYYTKVGDKDFSVPIDFNKTVKPGESKFSGTEKRSVERPATMSPTEIEDAMKNRKPVHTPFDVTEGAMETIKRDQAMPKTPAEEAAAAPKNNKGENLTFKKKQDQYHVETRADGKKIGELVAKDIGKGTAELLSNQIYDKDLRGAGRGQDQIKHFLENVGDDTKTVKSDISTSKDARRAWDALQKTAPEAISKKEFKDGQTQYTVDMEKWRGKHLPSASGGSPEAGTAKAKVTTPEELKEKLPELAQKHLTEEEKDSLTTTATGKPRAAGTEKFINNMSTIPSVEEYTDIALKGEGARKWYSRSTAAFDAMHEESPNYFKAGDKEKFLGVLAGSSPQQSVANNLRETLGLWKEWNDAGRPEPSIEKWKEFSDAADKAWKEDGSPRAGGTLKGASQHWDYAPQGPEWKTENLLLKNLTLPEAKVPNIIKALKGENMWPDLTKNSAFKAPSFAENLRKWIDGKSTGTKNVTNDSWMGLFGGIDKSALSKPENYHPLSVATRAAAEELGWEPEEAQAAIWSFTQALTEKGVEDPELIRHYSEDFKDLLANDMETRSKLEGLGVNLDQLDKKLEAIGEKPEVSGRSTPTSAHSVRQLRERIEEARGKGSIPESKSVQGNLFRENPAHESRSRVRDEATEFDPSKFQTQTSGELEPFGKKKSPLKKLR